jgi:filamentous hemagglutinin family protein
MKAKDKSIIARPLFLTALLASAAGYADVVFDGTVGPGGQLFGDMEVTEQHGTRVGANLFHSFSVLNVNPGESLTFTSDFAGLTNNVISRVTGTTASLIDGPVMSTIPGASLWLINPNGLVFGEGAFVDVQGSFHASTADYLLLEDGGRFGADIADTGNTTLTMANPAAFGFLDSDVAPIEAYGAGLFLPYGESFELVGGDIYLENTFIGADGGELGIAAVGGPGEVSRGETGYAGADAWGNISMLGSAAFANGDGGGAVYIRGGQFVMEQSAIEAQTFGPEDGRGITVQADDVTLTNNSFLVGMTHGDGRGNDVNIDAAGSVLIDGGSWIDNRVWANGDGGDITIRAGESITLDGVNEWGDTSRIAGATWGNGNGSDMLFEAPVITVSNGSFLWNSTRGDGHAGSITLNASESVNFVGTTPDGFSGAIYANSTQLGNSSDVTINTHDFNQLEAAYIIIGTYGPAAGGNLTINATGDVTMAGVGLLNDPVETWTGSRDDGPSGEILINAANMYMRDGAQLGSYAPGPSDAGAITLNIDGVLEVSGQAQADYGRAFQTMIDPTSLDGNGGTVTVRADEVRLVDGGAIVTTSFGLGDAGSVDIVANTFTTGGTTSGLVNEFGDVLWWTSGIWSIVEQWEGGDGGDISILADNITIGRGSAIHNFSGGGVSGDITITANESFTMGGAGELIEVGFVPGASIDAESRFGDFGDAVGGSIYITAPVITIDSGSYISSLALYRPGTGGNVEITASERLTISSTFDDWGPVINSEGAFSATPGNILLSAPDISISDAYILSDVSFSGASAGDIRIIADNSIVLDNFTTLAALSYYGGSGGEIRLEAPQVTMQNFSSIQTDTFGYAERAGDVFVNANNFTIASGSLISASSCWCAYGGAGSVYINVDTLDIIGTGFINLQTGILSAAYGSGDSGNIEIVANSVNMSDVAVILAYSLSTAEDFVQAGEPGRLPGDAGSISITANELFMEGSFIETTATESAGGNLELNISDMLFAEHSYIGAQANGVSTDSNGGNVILSSPQFVILDHSDIVASANAGNGGNITINTDAMIVAPFSVIDASSQLGVDGQVVVESPNRLVASVTPLEAPVLDIAEFSEDPCEVAVDRDRSSFTVPGSGGVIATPGDYQPSPIISMMQEQEDDEEMLACAPVAP